MANPLYDVWIHDDKKRILDKSKQYLERRFPDVLSIRTHASNMDVAQTLRDGGYEELSFRFDIDREEDMCRRSELPDIPPPDLVIQDYLFHPVADYGPTCCVRAIKKITQHFPNAKIAISTTERDDESLHKVLQENGWDFPLTDKVYLSEDRSIEDIIIDGLKQRGYRTPERDES